MQVKPVNIRPKPGFMYDTASGQIVPAAGNVLSLPIPLRDGLASLMTGRGTSIDRATSEFWHFMPQNPQQIVAGYRSNWLLAKIVDIPAEDMVREWRDWQADASQVEKLEEAERLLGIVGKVQQGIAYGRLGGGAMLLGYGDADPSAPAPKARRDGLKYIHVFNRWEILVGEEDRDITSPWYGQPQYYTIAGVNGALRIHPSRVIPFKGEPVPRMPGVSWEDYFWGDSIITRVDRAVKNAVKSNDGFAGLVDEAKLDIYRLSGMAQTLAQPGGEDKIRRRMEIAAQGKSMWRGTYMDKDDEWEQKQINWSGMPQMIETLLSVVAAAADIPATRLLGRAPQGMNATGEGDEKNYNTMIASKQRLYLSPSVDRLDEALIPHALGTRPKEVGYAWSPLSMPTEKERAETFKIVLEAVASLETNALAPSEVIAESVKSYVSNEQLLPGWDKAYADFEAKGVFDPNEDPSAIVPIRGKGGDPSASAGNGGSMGQPASRATNDAKPIPLYVQRKLLNASELIAWAKEQGFTSTLPADDMHVTVLYSRTPVDPIKMGETWSGDDDGKLTIRPGGPRAIEKLGENDVVLLFASEQLVWRHRSMVEAGASHDYEEYTPHVTISYEADLDLDAIKPFTGKLVFGPEIFEPLDLEWKAKIAEVD